MNSPFKVETRFSLRGRLAILLIISFVAMSGIVKRIDKRLTPTVESKSVGAETVEETVTLPATISTSKHYYRWVGCGENFVVGRGPEDIPGTMTVGYEHYYKKGASVIGCDEGGTWVNRGLISFDLTGIKSKAPPLHVSVTDAKLHFKADRDCSPHYLLIAQADWSKGYDGLVPGDEFSVLPKDCPSCGLLDVAKILNNWLRGESNGGYENHGFVIRGNTEEDWLSEGKTHWLDNDSCWTRYSDVSLTVTYKYDKAKTSGPTVIYVPPPVSGRTNVALASNGGVATSSSNFNSGGLVFTAAGANDGDRRAINWAKGGGGWNSARPNTFPDWLQIDFAGKKTIDEVDVFMVQDNYSSPSEPTETMTFALYGLTAFEVQYWNGSTWVTVPGGNVTSNNLVWRKLTFPAIATNKIRVLTHSSPDGYSRLTELEAWGS